VTNDDLTPWQDTPLMQALTADGSDGELVGENAAVSAFQKSSSRRRRGVVRLLGAGVTSVALVGVVGGGVAAAAYTRALPEPVQNALHDFLGPIGVPAPHKTNGGHQPTEALGARPTHSATAASASVVAPSSSPSVQTSASANTSAPAANPAGGHPLGGASPAVSVSASVSPQPTVTPSATAAPSATPTVPAGDPSTWSISATASSQLVPVHADVDVSGTLLDADGQPVPDHRVVIRVHRPGTQGWERMAADRTDANGSVQGQLADLTQNTVVAFDAGHRVHSSPLRIVVRPSLSVSVTPAADGTSYVVTVTADAGQPGDVINLVKHTPNGWEQVGQAQLDGSSSASFSVPAPKRQRGYVLRLPATNLHGVAATRIVLQPRS
jgi:hypothetical protein